MARETANNLASYLMKVTLVEASGSQNRTWRRWGKLLERKMEFKGSEKRMIEY